ncbi:MAG: oligosaccharide flippase family protein, partial [Acidobacteriales bacterium]|nr:oligosaccharide flippase family protein [Terriglobales bacterium]
MTVSSHLAALRRAGSPGTLASLASVVGGEFLLRLASLGAVVIMARLYGASVLGMYGTVLAYATAVVMLADNGLQTAAITEIGKRPDEVNHFVTQLHLSKTLLLFAVFLIGGIVTLWVDFSRQTMIAIWLLSLKTIVQSYCQLSGAILKSLGRMVVIGQIQTVHFLFLTAGLAFVFYGSPSLASLLGLLLAGQVLEWVLFGIVLGRSGVRPARVTSIECWKLIRRSTPFGIR